MQFKDQRSRLGYGLKIILQQKLVELYDQNP